MEVGWNEGYRIMEEQVVSLYDQKALNKKTLDIIMQPFCNTDIDSGGSRGLKTKDGKMVEDVVCCVMEPERYKEIMDNFVPDPEEPEYNGKLLDLWDEITKREWLFW